MGRNKFSAGVVVLRPVGAEWRYLLLRVFRTWDFPKGGVEAGELPLQAAIREVEEETALTRLEFPWGEVYRETTPYSDGKVARYYVASSPDRARVSLPINPELGRPEHHEFRWVSHAEAKLLLPDRLQAVLDWVHNLVGAPAASQALETKR